MGGKGWEQLARPETTESDLEPQVSTLPAGPCVQPLKGEAAV